MQYLHKTKTKKKKTRESPNAEEEKKGHADKVFPQGNQESKRDDDANSMVRKKDEIKKVSKYSIQNNSDTPSTYKNKKNKDKIEKKTTNFHSSRTTEDHKAEETQNTDLVTNENFGDSEEDNELEEEQDKGDGGDERNGERATGGGAVAEEEEEEESSVNDEHTSEESEEDEEIDSDQALKEGIANETDTESEKSDSDETDAKSPLKKKQRKSTMANTEEKNQKGDGRNESEEEDNMTFDLFNHPIKVLGRYLKFASFYVLS